MGSDTPIGDNLLAEHGGVFDDERDDDDAGGGDDNAADEDNNIAAEAIEAGSVGVPEGDDVLGTLELVRRARVLGEVFELFIMAPGDKGDCESGLFSLEVIRGSRKDTVASFFSLPAFWIMAEQFLASSICFSSAFRIMLCPPSAQWLTNDSVQANDSLHMKHINIGFTGTAE